MTTALVILVYNEVDGLRYHLPLLADISRKYGLTQIFAVDGGSSDGSLGLYQKYNINYYVQEKKGRGEAFKLAFAKSDEDALIFFSPDGNENIRDVSRFAPLLAQGADVVIASRMLRGARNEEDALIFKWRKWANQGFGLLANLFWNRSGLYVADTINGFRAIKRKAWQELEITASDYTVEYQATIHAFKKGLKIVEFPTQEGQRIGGESYAKSIPTGIRFARLFFRELFSR